MNPLRRILAMPLEEQQLRGLTDTPREIAHQPRAWMETVLAVRRAAPQLREFMAGVPRLVFSGAGTSHFIGLSLEGLFRRAGMDARAVASTDIVADAAEALPSGPLGMVSFARSGNGPEGNHAFRLAPGARHLVITCNPAAELYRLAGERPGPVRLLLPEMTNDRGLAMTSSYSSMVVAGQALLMLDDLAAFEAHVRQMGDAAQRVLDQYPERLEAVAARRPRRALFLGTGTLLGAAEAHLKVQEMTAGQVVGKAESFLGLRHGPMAVVDEETLVVCFVSSGPSRRRYELDLMQELREKKLGQSVVAVADSNVGLEGLADLVVEVAPVGESLSDDCRPPVYVVAAQLLALFLSMEFGLKPDAPSSGVINRVVQGVRIYEA